LLPGEGVLWGGASAAGSEAAEAEVEETASAGAFEMHAGVEPPAAVVTCDNDWRCAVLEDL